jgi:serine/threonine protein kinase
LQSLEKILASIGTNDLQSLTRIRDAISARCNELEKEENRQKCEEAAQTNGLPDVAFIDDGNAPVSSSTKIGDWDIGRELGSGAFAKVFAAKNRLSGRAEAVKVLVKQDLSPDSLQNARNEYKALCTIGLHQNIAGLTGVLQSQEHMYFFIGFAKGKELFDAIKLRQQSNKNMPLEAVSKILSEMSSALAHAHKLGVCHRDVKPENIIIAQDYSAMLVDFGCACPRYELQTQCVGSMPFIAPEFMLETASDGAPADVFSLGVVLLEMLHGLRALSKALGWDSEKMTPKECGYQLAAWFVDPVEGLSRLRSALGVNSQFDRDALLASMLHVDPQQRPTAESL